MTALISSYSSANTNYGLLIAALVSILFFQFGNVAIISNSFTQMSIIWSLLLESRFIQAFIASLTVIIFSELGDKTFFISAIMAMKNPRSTVFMASMSANCVMNAISVLMGVATAVIPKFIINYLSVSLFAFFGVKMIYESYKTSDNETQEELEEAENELKKLETSENKTMWTGVRSKLLPYLSLVFIETFSLIFFAEWGDRSQISTIVLAAREDPFGVVVGSLFGYSICTIIAVLGGRFMAQIISIKTVTLIGGILFLIFSIIAFVMG